MPRGRAAEAAGQKPPKDCGDDVVEKEAGDGEANGQAVSQPVQEAAVRVTRYFVRCWLLLWLWLAAADGCAPHGVSWVPKRDGFRSFCSAARTDGRTRVASGGDVGAGDPHLESGGRLHPFCQPVGA